MMLLIGLVSAFVALGCVLLSMQRRALRSSLQAEGFRAHEVRRAMKLHARKRYQQMDDYCQSVRDRRARAAATDWTNAESYIAKVEPSA